MFKKKNYLLLSLLAIITLVLAACNFGGESTDEKETGTNSDSGSTESSAPKELNLVVASEPPSLHPQLATDSTSAAILNNTFEGLTRLNKDGQPENAMAEDIQVSEDKLTYTFKLRDAKWSNGDPVVASDFVYAWNFALNPDNASEYATILYPIKGAEAYNTGAGSAEDLGIKEIDEKTLEVTLENPTAYFLELVAFKTFFPLNEKVVEANPEWYADAGEDFVTNGPFTLSDWSHNASLTLEKYADYWDAESVNLSTVNIDMVEKESTAVTMFKAGDIDYLGSPYQTVGLDSIDAFKKDGTLQISDYAAIYWYKFNTQGEFTSNVNIRKALTLAINRQELIDNVIKGEQKPATSMVPAAIAEFEDDRGYMKDNDIEGAKAALELGMKELGITDPSEIKIGLSINTSEAHAAIAQFIQEGWNKNLGIEATIDNSEWQVYLDKLNVLDFDVARMGWIADYNDAYTFLEMYSTADNGNNDTGWENAQYKELMSKSVSEPDPAKRLEILKEAEAIAMSEFPVAPIYYYTNLHVKSDKVKNMEQDRLGNIQLKWVDIAE